MKLISSESGANFKSTFKRLCDLSDAFEQGAKTEKLTIAKTDNLGYLTSSPGIIGTGFKVKVILKLPMFSQDVHKKKLIALCQKKELSIKKLPVGDNWDVSNYKTIGVTEVDIVNSVASSVAEILKIENNLHR